MLGIAIGLIIANLTITVAVGVVVTKHIDKVNKNIGNNIEISCDVNGKLKDLDLKEVEERLKDHISKETWDLSFRKKPNILILKEER